jgi:hypothetical protein
MLFGHAADERAAVSSSGVTTRPLDRLSPESRAVLSLILLQARSYADIAALLRLPDDDVRQRAHEAAQHLVDSDAPPAPDVQAQVIDYLLGEQTVSEREQTRSILQSDPLARAWAVRLVDGLSPLAKRELPAIPDPPAGEATPSEEEPNPTAEVPAATTDEPSRATDNDTVTAAEPEPTPRLTLSTPGPVGRSPRRVRPRARLLAAALGALVIVVVVIILASSGGGSNKPAPSGVNATQLVLTPTPAAAGAGGSVTVRRQNGRLVAEIRGHGLAPNTQSNSYGVWLYNTSSDALLLGFVSPSVGRSGTFGNGTALPANASRFHFLIVTVETGQQPSKPGAIALRAPLRLP